MFSPNLIHLEPQDVILASDCFYDTKGKEMSSHRITVITTIIWVSID
jgi:hypothetical protein